MSRKAGVSWRTKLLLLLFVFSLVPLLAVARWSYTTARTTFEQQVLEGLQAVARAKAEAIDQFIGYRRTDVERLAELVAPDMDRARKTAAPPPGPALPKLADAEALPPPGKVPPTPVPTPVPPKAPEPTRDVTEIKRTLGLLLWDQSEFEELMVLDEAGRVLVSTFDGHENKNAAALDYFERGRKATYVAPVFLSPITQQLTMNIATPIRNAKAEDLGVLVARLNLKRFFRLVNDATGLGTTGETLVGKRLEGKVVFMAPTRHDPEAALKRTLEENATQGRALVEAARGMTGTGVLMDYRGLETFAAWSFIPSIEWGLVAKVDSKEALAGVRAMRDRTLILIGVLILAIIPVGVLAAGALLRPLRELHVATERISRGDFDVQLAIRSRDEIGALADSFERMVAAIKFFREHSRSSDDDDDLGEEGDGNGNGARERAPHT